VTQFAALARYVDAFAAGHSPQPSVPPLDFHGGKRAMPSRR
jgi:hypothetical protein